MLYPAELRAHPAVNEAHNNGLRAKVTRRGNPEFPPLLPGLVPIRRRFVALESRACLLARVQPFVNTARAGFRSL
jgi:hypothetical protein